MTGWRKSSYCDTGCSCVWVDIHADTVRLSNCPVAAGTGTTPVLTFTRDEWAAFLAGVLAGEFDIEEQP